MTSFDRMDRINELLQEEIAKILMREIKDPRIGFVSVTRVKTNKDLKNAQVYVSIYGKKESHADTLRGLESAAGYIRGQLFKSLTLKTIPKLIFVLDDSIAYSAHISSLLQELSEEDEQGHEEAPEEEEGRGRDGT